MTRNLLPIVALAALVACGDGAPFGTPPVTDPDPGTQPDPTPDPGTDPDAEEGGIPDDIASTVTGFTYNPGAGTMTLTGTLRDGDARTTTFTRNAALDVRDANSGAVVYEAFTAQDDPLDEHTTVYARTVGDVSGAVAVTGGQFTYYSGGVSYTRTGGFEPSPIDEAQDTGLVTYAGQYAGLTNLNGPNTDLLAVDPSVPAQIRPAQAGPVTGRVFINVSFADNNLGGLIYDRQVTSGRYGTFNVSDLVLVPTELGEDGTFSGEVELPFVRTDVGVYGGLIGGNEGEAMAGGIFVDEHFDEEIDPATGNPITDPITGAAVVITGEEEFGIFVLGRCGGALEDTSPECAPPVDPR